MSPYTSPANLAALAAARGADIIALDTATSAAFASLASSSGSGQIGHLPKGTNSVPTTVKDVLNRIVSVADYRGSGVSDTTAFRNAAFAAGNGICLVPFSPYVPAIIPEPPGQSYCYTLTDSVSYPCTFLVEPGTLIQNSGFITGDCVSYEPRDYEAMMGMGNFNVWLDGTEFINPLSGSFAATLWRVFYNGTGGSCTIKQADGPTTPGATNSFYWGQTVAASADTYRLLEFRVEDASTFGNDFATLSFLAKGDTSFTCTAEVAQFFGSSSGVAPQPAAEVTVISIPFTVKTNIQRFVFPMKLPSIQGKQFGNNIDDCVKIRIKMPINAVFGLTLQECKFERGVVRTPFSAVPLSIQQGYIDRYLQYSVLSIGATAPAANQYLYQSLPFKAEMRRIPDITFSNLPDGSDGNLKDGVKVGHREKYGASVYIQSAAAGAFFAVGKRVKMDARL